MTLLRWAFALSLQAGLLLPGPQGTAQSQATDFLANNTVLIVRHAEKPPQGRELTPAGEARARAYATYFEPFNQDGFNVRVDALYAGADSSGSIRPRLTLEPLSQATGLALNTAIGTKDPTGLVALLRNQAHKPHPLIAWRHGGIPTLLEAFGASPVELLPGAKWPDDTFDWVIVLGFDSHGHLAEQKLVKEHLTVHE